ncbi:MAG TPA: hypothetical protein VFK21_10730 [Gammaproteobacteria bacterium]|nr:hypothetical protein [Gammaproteobacteria bacterium]
MVVADRRTASLAIVASPVFIVALALLLLNDFVLKSLLHDWFTGKLSDFAGLFVFGSLLMIVIPRRPRLMLIGAGFLFIWWKSPLSQPVIDLWNAGPLLKMHRVVDYSDLMALVVLPLVYWNSRKQSNRKPSPFIIYPVGIVALFAVMATSSLPPLTGGSVHLEDDSAERENQTHNLYAAIDTYARNHDLQIVTVESDGWHRKYAKAGAELDINYDPSSGTLYYALGGNGYKNLNSIGQEFAREISGAVPSVKLEPDGKVQRYSLRPRAEIIMEFPAHRFIWDSCENAGTDNPDVQHAYELFDTFAHDYHLSPSRGYAGIGSTLPCLAHTERDYRGGSIVGAFADSLSYEFETHAQFGLRSTKVILDFWSCCGADESTNEMSAALYRRLSSQTWNDPDVELDSLETW